MSKVLDVGSDSSTEEYSYEDFKREQAEANKKSASVELEGEKPNTPEAAPHSEAVKPQAVPEKSETAQPKQVLSDEEKSRQKHANDGRRNRDYLKRISELEAENTRLKGETSVKRTSETATTKDATANDGAPDPKDAKYQGDNGWLQFVDDRAEWKADQKLKAYQERIETEKRTATVTEIAHSFAGKVEAYREANADKVEEFTEALDIVREALENDFPEISGEIASHEKSPELIHYLGTNLDVFSRITSAKGKPMAMKLYRGIVEAWEKPVSEATTTKPLPKPPVNLNGRGRTPTADEVQDKAVEDNDFTTWQQHEHSKPKGKGSKWDRY